MPAQGVGGSSEAEIPVVVIDDQPIWRDGLRSLLRASEFTIAGEAGTAEGGLQTVRSVLPRLVLLETRLGRESGLEVLSQIKAEHPQVAVAVLTTYDNPLFKARAAALGAAGYLLKDIGRDALLATLRAAARGEVLLSRRETARGLRGLGDHAAETWDLIEPLSKREEEVLRLVATGMANREIASMLYLAESTIKSHVESITEKLGASGRVQAAVWAVRHGLVPFSDDGSYQRISP